MNNDNKDLFVTGLIVEKKKKINIIKPIKNIKDIAHNKSKEKKIPNNNKKINHINKKEITKKELLKENQNRIKET